MMSKIRRSVLFFVLYGLSGASSRYRVYQYLPFLKREGISYTVYPFYTERFEFLSLKCSSLGPMARNAFNKVYLYYGYLKRFLQILSASRYDTVFIQKELMPKFLLNLLCRLNKNLIFDFDDAIFLSDKEQESIFGMVMLKKSQDQTDMVLRRAHSVVVGNRFIGSYAETFCPRVTMIPIAIDTARYKCIPKENRESVVLGWIGRQRNAYYIDDLEEIFSRLSREFAGRLELLIIGAQKARMDSLRVACKPWNYASEIKDLSAIDIGLMPLRDEDWSRGKGGCKLLQYMALGIATVSSPVGINNEIINDGVNGFLAFTKEEWFEKIACLIRDPGLRSEMGKRAQDTVFRKYSLDKWQKIFLDTILNGAGAAN
ncbi:MAG TPA: hypothetical protein DCL49_12935 [Candidatus Omnitrophica bacterium]|nr:hypothetical protein [Candidatus Omnitrophota bacterium]